MGIFDHPTESLWVIDFGDGSFWIGPTAATLDTVVENNHRFGATLSCPTDDELDLIRFEGEGGLVRD